MSAGLFGHHRALLHERGISDEVIAARGYSSTAKAEWLTGEGFGQAVSRLGSGLVIPVFGAAGYQRFYQFRPDAPRMRDGKPAKYELPYGQRLAVDVPPGITRELASPRRPLWVTESVLKADAAVSAGLVCVGTIGAMGWRGRNRFGGRTLLADWRAIAWEGREVFIADDSDMATNADVMRSASELGAIFARWGADVRWVFIPPAHDGGKQGLDDWLARNGRDIHGLLTFAGDEPPDKGIRLNGSARGAPPTFLSKVPGPAPAADPCTLADAEEVVGRWLRLSDMRPVRAMLAAAVAAMLPGDPVWLLLVAAASSAKTELLSGLAGLGWVHPAGAITEAALLSGTSIRERAADATGGLLRQVGDRGLVLCKDFGSLLSMQRDARAATLAALREVYDGSWVRPVGTDGGKVLRWTGHCALLGGVTPTVDRHHAVIGVLGDRYLMTRFAESDDPEADAMRALAHGDREADMRAEIRAAVHGVIASALARPDPPPRSGGDSITLAKLAVFAARARTPIDRDGYTGELLSLPAVEGPGRLVKQLARLHAALALIGDPDPMRTVGKVALDCMPAVRARLLAGLLRAGRPLNTRDIAATVGMRSKTAARHLEDLALLKLAERAKAGEYITAASEWKAGRHLLAAAGDGLLGAWTETSGDAWPPLAQKGNTT